MNQLDKSQIFLKYWPSTERQQSGVPNRVYANVFMVKVSKRICFLYPYLNFDIGRAQLPTFKQEFTEKVWRWTYTCWARIMAKSVKVCQTSLCIWEYQNQIILVGLQRFDHDENVYRPPFWKKSTSNLFLLFVRISVYLVDRNRTTRKSEEA